MYNRQETIWFAIGFGLVWIGALFMFDSQERREVIEIITEGAELVSEKRQRVRNALEQ